MRRLTMPRGRRLSLARGFTLVEAMIALLILSILLGVGYSTLGRMIQNGRNQNAVEFYYAGIDLAHRAALGNISQSRLVLVPNATSGQFDWQVDICFPAFADCSETSGDWSKVGAQAKGDPLKTAGFTSVLRSAEGLPNKALLTVALLPLGNDSIYFRPNGWIDDRYSDRLEQMRFTPKTPNGNVNNSALSVSLAGIVSRCDHTKTYPDSRACP